MHNVGSELLTCGEIKLNRGIQLLEAFNFALNYVNNGSGMFHGKLGSVKLGGVAIDACSDSRRAGQLMANMFSNGALFAQPVQPSLIDVVVGSFSSDETIAMADILTPLKMPQISYGATSQALNNENTYPYFLRTVPADDKLSRAIVALLRQYSVNYVQVIYSGSYGTDAVNTFTLYASRMGICISQTIEVTSSDVIQHSDATAAVLQLLQAPNATVVVAFLITEHITTFLQAFLQNSLAKATFRFIGSDSWAANINFKTLGETPLNLITFGVETADVSDFDKYLSFKTPANYQLNPWFFDYYLTMFSCYSTAATSQCANYDKGVIYSAMYQQDRYVLYVINAVFSAALAIDDTLKQLCGSGYTSICDNYLQNGDRRTMILQALKRVNFTDYTKQLFQYQNGESNRGFHIYSLDSQSNYFQVTLLSMLFAIKLHCPRGILRVNSARRTYL